MTEFRARGWLKHSTCARNSASYAICATRDTRAQTARERVERARCRFYMIRSCLNHDLFSYDFSKERITVLLGCSLRCEVFFATEFVHIPRTVLAISKVNHMIRKPEVCLCFQERKKCFHNSSVYVCSYRL